MDYRFWTLTLFPGAGWCVVRWVKHGTLFAVQEATYDRLTRSEAIDVLDSDSSWVLGCLLRGELPAPMADGG